MSNRTELSFSDAKRRDGLLRTAYMKIAEGFEKKPEPSNTWYETATGDTTPWRTLLFVPSIRKAILAAVASGNRELAETTLEAALSFCDELKADFVSLVPQTQEESIVQAALEETHEEGKANEVEMALVQNPCPTSAERAIGPLSRQSATLLDLIERCRTLARQPQMRRA